MTCGVLVGRRRPMGQRAVGPVKRRVSAPRHVRDALPELLSSPICQDEEHVIDPQHRRKDCCEDDNTPTCDHNIPAKPQQGAELDNAVQRPLKVQRGEDEKIDDKHCQEQYRGDKPQKIAIVALSNAVVDKRAVVVVAQDAVVAVAAVRRARRPDDVARAAPAVTLPEQVLGHDRLVDGAAAEQVVPQSGLELAGRPRGQDHVSAREDAWVRAACRQEEAGRDKEHHESCAGQCEGTMPNQLGEHPEEVQEARAKDHGPDADGRREELGGAASHEEASAEEEVVGGP
eukprot:CAMPEP_0168436590 /NCGR_PEP_ID=MMETSP0228-20121227/41003_1 /TAXON_ID=133427 /ORGANISM="Protoceratium reticulatum, Strain CCCM 535 (=CCMP 1889)" /LENGTH=286 /DNA_ID=CAMNT_0008450789 /DNA_START=172 /DNA_END=1030 /DNA_ORIENTATION=-